MIIGIMGRDGMGKTSVAKMIGQYLARDSLTAVVNTDMTLPTTIQTDSPQRSLGHYLSLAVRQPVTSYLQQHPKIKNLFFAGTAMMDDIFSYQMDLDKVSQAEYFLEECEKEVGHVVIDISGQSVDPFLPAGAFRADMLLFLTSCDKEGINNLYAMERLFRAVKCPVHFALSKTFSYHDKEEFERTAGCKIDYEFPFCYELLYANACGKDFSPAGKLGKIWDKEIRRVVNGLLTAMNRRAANG